MFLDVSKCSAKNEKKCQMTIFRIVCTVFYKPFCVFFMQIFDNDGDGLLSYQEFIAMMKDRVNRGLKTFSRQEGWAGFKRCVKQELRSN